MVCDSNEACHPRKSCGDWIYFAPWAIGVHTTIPGSTIGSTSENHMEKPATTLTAIGAAMLSIAPPQNQVQRKAALDKTGLGLSPADMKAMLGVAEDGDTEPSGPTSPPPIQPRLSQEEFFERQWTWSSLMMRLTSNTNGEAAPSQLQAPVPTMVQNPYTFSVQPESYLDENQCESLVFHHTQFTIPKLTRSSKTYTKPCIHRSATALNHMWSFEAYGCEQHG